MNFFRKATWIFQLLKPNSETAIKLEDQLEWLLCLAIFGSSNPLSYILGMENYFQFASKNLAMFVVPPLLKFWKWCIDFS